MNSNLPGKVFLPFIILFLFASGVSAQNPDKLNSLASDRLSGWKNPLTQFAHIAKPRIDSVKVTTSEKLLKIYFAPPLSYYPFRESTTAVFNESLKKSLGRKFRKYSVSSWTNGYSIEQFVPNIYRKDTEPDTSRIIRTERGQNRFIERAGCEYYLSGLDFKSIALWHSHGYFYEASLDRWEFQRARLFGIVEDLSVMGYVIPFLTEMLEKAGATVFLPRERDFQVNEVIVDNDRSDGASEVVLQLGSDNLQTLPGFLLKDTLFSNENPFRMGTSLRFRDDSALYIPEIPESGDYAVYVSWPAATDNSNRVKYTVRHSGGETVFLVDQQRGGGTWIYLGKFRFRKGKTASEGAVLVSDASGAGAYVGIDAVRFGGGMGNIARRPSAAIIANQRSVAENAPVSESAVNDVSTYSWKTSGKPRFIEGARYYLQYAGMPDTLVYSPNMGKNDYNDDYQSRGLWVNYLISSPGDNPLKPAGLGIPLDISFAFHTDAGVTPGDSVIGTLAIYSTASDNGKFPGGYSRMASRDLSDIIQTQIVEDIRIQFDSSWTRRGLWDRPYAEARRPNVPAMLLELLSHQNKADQVLGLDPRYRFAVSRAIYKGILKYFSYTENRPYVVQPLPVTGFAITPVAGKKIHLSWDAVADNLEPTSLPDRYRVYTRKGDGGFDEGFITPDNYAEIELGSFDQIYSFKVTAVNDGGESFDSEILSAGVSSKGRGNVLVVNGFDRISGPSWFDTGGMAGVEWWNDRGVPYQHEISAVGDQYDFNRKSIWLDDDNPGWGASWEDLKGVVIAGNTFDYSSVHGGSILKTGYSFFSVSDEYFTSDKLDPSSFSIIDIILGEERSTPSFPDKSKRDFVIYTPEFMNKVKELTAMGRNMFISGSYVGTDLMRPGKDSTAIKFASEYLHFSHRSGHAVNNGDLYATDFARNVFSGSYRFNSEISDKIYQVEAPDAIEPAGRGAVTAFRYSQNNTSAGILYEGVHRNVVLGFPFETITSVTQRDELMRQIIEFLSK